MEVQTSNLSVGVGNYLRVLGVVNAEVYQQGEGVGIWSPDPTETGRCDEVARQYRQAGWDVWLM